MGYIKSIVNSLLICLIFSAGLLGNSYAQESAFLQPSQEERQLMTDCVEQENLILSQMVGCIGKVYSHCNSGVTSPNEKALKRCVSKEQALWRERLDTQLEQLILLQTKDLGLQVKEAQAAWLEAMLLNCRIRGQLNNFEKQGALAEALCINKMTAIRSLVVQELLKNRSMK
ncbi:lysozyme inhibitor LprI family protein [Polycladidibacter stylochi]|uniref:lysozyme inhibitor LprI family protein n=1 Tax=Polycladidibacter stylochi TaxID=1807766 RepID=UPI0008343236|nr:lysozyme inhibitor LprI family protein [Pseudovibrio stylochi]